MNWPFILSVVVTGLVVVFIALILLVIFVYLYGTIYTSMTGKEKQEKKSQAPAPVVSKPIPAPVRSDDAADGLTEEILAAIAGAVYAISEELGTPLSIQSIRPAAQKTRGMRSAWAAAGIAENTRSF